MDYKTWAEKEVELACKQERGNKSEEEFDYMKRKASEKVLSEKGV